MVMLDRLLSGEQAEPALGASIVKRDVQCAEGFLANAKAVALPMPEVPPVIRTVLFSKIFIVGLNLTYLSTSMSMVRWPS